MSSASPHLTGPSDDPGFAGFIRILGRGPSRSRSLTLEEAERAMAMVCADAVEPLQLGAWLVLMRYRGESPAELAGMVRALRATVIRPAEPPAPDLDWPTYAAGRTRGLPWFVLSALLLADHGIRVFMHGSSSDQKPHSSAERTLATLGITAAESVEHAAQRLRHENFAYMPLRLVCPRLQTLIELRQILGLRTAANTLARLLNPFLAPGLIQGVFHPPYRDLQHEAASLLDQPALAVFKGGGGEAERPASKICEVLCLDHGQSRRDSWPPLLAATPPDDDALNPDLPRALWRDEVRNDHATALVTGSAAIALHLLGKAESPADADALARQWWDQRDRHRFPAG